MELIESKVELIEQGPGLAGIYKQIELAGRTCYKSEDKITEDSAKEFVDRMIKLGHGAMLEHGTVYLKVPKTDTAYIIGVRYEKNKYSKSIYVSGDWYITTNLRVLVENGWLDDLQYICEPTEFHEKRITVKFVCDRGVSHEYVRHRVFSFAQESTRYCNYSKDKFGNELTFIHPSWSLAKMHEEDHKGDRFIDTLYEIEKQYFYLIENGWKPQQAGQILPNALKTEIVVTGFESDWKRFLDLRTSGAAHPDMRKLALELKDLMYGCNEEQDSDTESSRTDSDALATA